MTIDDVRLALKAAVDDAGGARAWCRPRGISDAYVSDVLKSKRDPGEKILSALGIVKEVEYEWVDRG